MPTDSQPRLSLETSTLIAYATVSLLWGSTYLAIRIGVQYMPPALFAASRFLLAGLMLLFYARLTSQPLPSRAVDWRTNIIVGLLLLTIGNGLVVWGEQFVESGLAAIFIVTSPLWMVLFCRHLARAPVSPDCNATRRPGGRLRGRYQPDRHRPRRAQ